MANYTLLVIAVLLLFVVANLYQIVVIDFEVVANTAPQHGPPLDKTEFVKPLKEEIESKPDQVKPDTTSKQDEAKLETSSKQDEAKLETPSKQDEAKPENEAALQGEQKSPPLESTNAAPEKKEEDHPVVAGLKCARYGGPSDEVATEMVYWKDIPQDSKFVSPFKQDTEQYLTFEPDEGGWNNIRMGMETTVMLAISMGRTMVLPPEQNLYLLNQKGEHGQHKNVFGFGDFFHFQRIQKEHQETETVKVLTFTEFLEKVAMQGKLRSAQDGSVVFPPDNQTNWDSMGHNYQTSRGGGGKKLWPWVREHMTDTGWDPDNCVAYFPAVPNNNGEAGWKALNDVLEEDKAKQRGPRMRIASFTGHPTPVDGELKDRLAEMMADRSKLCVYNSNLQQRHVIHFKGEQSTKQRMLIHFYAFLFFEDWRQGLWTKRFVRDHLRYVDEIQCAAARVVNAVRQISKSRGDPTGSYDSFHIRRGDFQYKDMHMEAAFIYSNNTRQWLQDGRTVFVATDEKKRDYFEPLKKHYHLLFLSDFKEELGDVNTNFYGMIDQLVASRGEIFTGAFYSTFTGYINRVRGYHAQNKRGEGWEQGAMKSYYYTPLHLEYKRRVMHQYKAIEQGFWSQEFHTAWRDIEHDLDQ